MAIEDLVPYEPALELKKLGFKEPCFGGGYFIVTAKLPSGQISNHYQSNRWDDFKVPETSKALFPFDGHTSHAVLDRLKKVLA